MDFEAIKRAAEGYRDDMSRFLRDMIAIPSESCQEEQVVLRIARELEKLTAAGKTPASNHGLGTRMDRSGASPERRRARTSW